jgi:hypothetical protein
MLALFVIATQARADDGDTRFVVRYRDSKFSSNAPTYAGRQIFDPVASSLNMLLQPSTLPVSVKIEAADCGVVNAAYDPTTHRIRMCYELLDSLNNAIGAMDATPQDKDGYFIGAAQFILLHETGHAFQDLLERGGLGNPEDEADHFAAFIAINSGDENMLAGAVLTFAYLAKQETITDERLKDVHAPNLARIATVMCLAYGSNPEHFALLKAVLGGRALGCAHEWQSTDRAWRKQLRRFMRNGDQ